MPELEGLERTVEQARRGDWIKDALLRVVAADLLEKGELLPPPVRNYIVTSLLGGNAKLIEAEFRELSIELVELLVSYLQPEISREEVENSAAKAVERIRQIPEKFSRGRRLPESLREFESFMVWVLFMVKQWEITSVNTGDAKGVRSCEDAVDGKKVRSWLDAVDAVSEQLDPDRESADGKDGKQKLRSGYSPRSIANILKYFMSKATAQVVGPPKDAPPRGPHPREALPVAGDCSGS
jgi:hypothetical protein